MVRNGNAKRGRNGERGISLFLVAGGMVFLLGVCALAIDVASLYVARNEAQRAADAGALAGAKAFVESGFTSGLVTQAVAQTLATARAIDVGAQNKVGGQAAQILGGDVTFDFSKPTDPRITVVVQRTAASGNPMPTFFAKVFGVLTGDVAATATAEAYSGSPGGPSICAACLKPVVLPNCDPLHAGPIPNPFCGIGFGKYVDPTCVTNPSYPGICNPGPFSGGGVIGMPLQIRPGLPSDAPAPSQYYTLDLDCSGNSPESDITSCNTQPFTCGSTLCVQNGATVGPVGKGFRTLIHESPGNGQDTINTSVGPPFQMTGGGNNPNPALIGQPVSTSDSIITVPLYDGHPLCPGGSCGFQVTIVGYLQLFVTQVGPPCGTGSADVCAVVLNVSACGAVAGGPCTAGSGTGGPTGTVSGGASLIPIRLVRNPGS